MTDDRRTFLVEYASGAAAAERQMQQAKEITFGAGVIASREDRDNFVTNRVSLQEATDSGLVQPNDGAVLGLSAAWACINILAGTVATLPLAVNRTLEDGSRAPARNHPLYRILHDSPNADQTAVDFWEFVGASIELRGNAYAEIQRMGGRIVGLLPLMPDQVSTRRGARGVEYRVNGSERWRPTEEVFHVRGFGGGALGGVSTIQACASSFASALSAERASTNVFNNGIRPSGLMTVDKPLSAEQRTRAEEVLQRKFSGAMNAGKPMLLDNGTKWQQLTINPEDAQMLESRRFGVEEICRIFGVPPHMIGHTEASTSWGTGIEQQTLGFVKFALRRRVKRIEQAIEKQLLSPTDRAQGYTVEFNLEGLLRGDSQARAAFYQVMTQIGAMTINEVRRLENLPPVEGGDVPRMQSQNVPITQAPEPPALPPPAPEDSAAFKAIQTLSGEFRAAQIKQAATPPPVINIRMPEIRQPNVTVEAPKVTVNAEVKRGIVKKTISRDDRGLITDMTEEES